MAYIVMAYIFMAYIVMAYIFMTYMCVDVCTGVYAGMCVDM